MTELKRSRGRPATFDQDAALAAAVPLFWRHGYDGTSISMLTEAMGVTPPTLYSAFGSKELLYCQVLDFYQRQTETGDEALLEGASVRRLLEVYLRASAHRFSGSGGGRGCMIMIGSLQVGPDEEGAARAAAGARASAVQRLEALLNAAKSNGELAAGTNCRSLAQFYMAVIEGMAVQGIDGASDAELDGLVDIAFAAWPSPATLA